MAFYILLNRYTININLKIVSDVKSIKLLWQSRGEVPEFLEKAQGGFIQAPEKLKSSFKASPLISPNGQNLLVPYRKFGRDWLRLIKENNEWKLCHNLNS
ncbi:hypothetical protein B4U84_02445 [Westiellopsis prolifica IICB1]|nr:hypothetical protein B4U84_02445 [Westiellopsis prolifica IICB1]